MQHKLQKLTENGKYIQVVSYLIWTCGAESPGYIVFQVSVLEGALDCWVFLSCLEVLHRIEGCCDPAQLAANCSHTVGLWAYATDKVTLSSLLVDVMELHHKHISLYNRTLSIERNNKPLCSSVVEVLGGALWPGVGERAHIGRLEQDCRSAGRSGRWEAWD